MRRAWARRGLWLHAAQERAQAGADIDVFTTVNVFHLESLNDVVAQITGGQRLHRYEDYVEALTAAGLSSEPFAAYLEAFRHGMPPHGGFAIGLERLLMQLLGLGNLRLATLFPRDRSRLTP